MITKLIAACAAAFTFHSMPLTRLNPYDSGQTGEIDSLGNTSNENMRLKYFKSVLPAGDYHLGDKILRISYGPEKGIWVKRRDITFLYDDGIITNVLSVHDPVVYSWRSAHSRTKFEVDAMFRKMDVQHEKGNIETKMLVTLDQTDKPNFIWYENSLGQYFAGTIDRFEPKP
jgi:hypothetical protein